MKQSKLVDHYLVLDGVKEIGRVVEFVEDREVKVVLVGLGVSLRKIFEIEESLNPIESLDFHSMPFPIPRKVGKIDVREHWERPFGNRVKTRLSHSTKSRRRGFR